MDSQQLAAARAAIPDFLYQPLDESRKEIRVLSLLPPGAPLLSDLSPGYGSAESEELRSLVHCTIEHVSLDDVVPNYESFTTQLKPISRRNTDESWRSFSNDHHRARSPDGGAGTPLFRVRSHSRYHRFTWGDYGALSYTWGDQSNKVPIVMNGQVVQVGKNLEKALRALSTDSDYIDGLKLWADAICINQRDLEERNRQVKRMGDIFGRSLIVTIWLGHLPEGADVEGMRLIHECITKCKDDEVTADVVNELFSDDDVARRRLAVDAIDVLAHATYWSRVWIIQEKCLGPFNPSILFETFRFGLIPLQRFLARANNILGAVRAREKVWRILKLIELTIVNQEGLLQPVPSNKEQLAARRRRDAEDLTLLLMLGRLAGAVDLRDKLYGLMGMIPEYVTEHIEPDYAKPVAEVFSDFARALVLGFENFDLVLTGTSETELELPSWVPDLTDPWDPALWGTDCEASGGRAPDFRVEGQGGSVVIAKGLIVDTVDGTAPYLGWTAGELSIWKPAVDPSSPEAVAPSSEQDIKTAIVRTLHRDALFDCTTGTTLLDIPWYTSADPTAEDLRVIAMREKGWDPVLRHANLADFHAMRTRLNDTWHPWGREFRSFFPDEDEVPECRDPEGFIKSLDKHCGIVYPVMSTGKGRFGTAIRPVQSGDKVAVILGSTGTIVLRPKGENEYEVISKCYVEGLMRGEAMDALEKGELVLEDIKMI